MADKNCVCISYNGYFLVPVPMVSISKSYETDGSGRSIGSTISVKLTGKLVAAGDPTKSREDLYEALLDQSPCVLNGQNTSFGVGISVNGTHNLMNEEKILRAIFRNSNFLHTDGDGPLFGGYAYAPGAPYIGNENRNRLLIVANGTTIINGFAKVVSYSANQTDNNWTNTIDYDIELTLNEDFFLFLNNTTSYLLQSVTDDISIEPIEETNLWNTFDPVVSTVFGFNSYASNTPQYQINTLMNYPIYATRYRVSRTIEAVGKHSFNEMSSNEASDYYKNRTSNGTGSAFDNARAYVLDRIRHYPTPYFLSGWTIVNRVRVINGSETNGTFRLTETSMAVDPNFHPPWADDWSAEVTVDNTMLQTVRINGTIKGLETLDPQVRLDNPIKYDVQPKPDPSPVLRGNELIEPAILPPGPTTNTNYRTTAFPTINGPIGELDSGQGKFGKYQNALRGLHWLKAHLDGANVYNSPIVNRAKLFFFRTTSLPGSDTFVHNPYKYLNNPGIIAERNAGANAASTFIPTNPIWNFGGQVNATFNPIPVSMSESHRSHAGEIDYSIEFNNRPINIIPGSISESLTINDSFPVQQIAEIFVLGRRIGPVIQDLGATTAATRDVNFEVVLPRPPQIASRFIFPQYQYQAALDVVEQLNPKYMFGTNPWAIIKSYIKSDSQNYNPLEGRISIQKSWTWQRAS